MGRQKCVKTSHNTLGSPTTKNYPAPNVNITEIEKLCARQLNQNPFQIGAETGFGDRSLGDCNVNAIMGAVFYDQVLCVNKDGDVHRGFQSLLTKINKTGAQYLLRIANRLFGEETCDFLSVSSTHTLKKKLKIR